MASTRTTALLVVLSKVSMTYPLDHRKHSDRYYIEDGPVGGTAQKVGGPFDKEGAVGKQFAEGGSVGGTAQSAAQGEKPSVFDAKGMIGKQFKSQYCSVAQLCIANPLHVAEGAIGGTAQKIGGPFDKDGMIGKQFKPDGTLGGTVQGNLGDKK